MKKILFIALFVTVVLAAALWGAPPPGYVDEAGIVAADDLVAALALDADASKLRSRSAGVSTCYTPELAANPFSSVLLASGGAPYRASANQLRPSPWDAQGLGDDVPLNLGRDEVLGVYSRWTAGTWPRGRECEEHGRNGCAALSCSLESLGSLWRPSMEVLRDYEPQRLTRSASCSAGRQLTQFEVWLASAWCDTGMICRALEIADNGSRRTACWSPLTCSDAPGCITSTRVPTGTVAEVPTAMGCSVPVCGLGTIGPPDPPSGGGDDDLCPSTDELRGWLDTQVCNRSDLPEEARTLCWLRAVVPDETEREAFCRLRRWIHEIGKGGER